MGKEKRKDMLENQVTFLLGKKALILSIEVNTKEDVEQIIRWMYSADKPMTATIKELSWDKELVDKNISEALNVLIDSINPIRQP